MNRPRSNSSTVERDSDGRGSSGSGGGSSIRKRLRLSLRLRSRSLKPTQGLAEELSGQVQKARLGVRGQLVGIDAGAAAEHLQSGADVEELGSIGCRWRVVPGAVADVAPSGFGKALDATRRASPRPDPYSGRGVALPRARAPAPA